MSRRRVVVTGMGIVSPVGSTVDGAWDAICNGRSGIRTVAEFDASHMKTRIAGEVTGFDVADYLSPREAKRFDDFVHYGYAAAVDALKDSGLLDEDSNHDPERVGCAVGSGIGGLKTIEATTEAYLKGGPRKVSPFFIPGSIINMIGGHLSIVHNLKGPNLAIVTACSTATHNIGSAARMIQHGEADAMVAGGAEYATTPTSLSGFISARAMSTRNDEPEKASRPWDEDRDGFVLSNGAGVIVLEELEHAKQRGATIYAEVIGFGMSADAYHMTAPPDDGEGAGRCMRVALQDAGIAAQDVDYINAHGTSTPLGDLAETIATKTVFGDHAYKLAVSSTKSMTGHLLGAAGGVEAIFSLLSVRDGIIPPTINLDTPGDGCDLDYVPHTARETNLNIAISNSFGFGGTNGSLVFRKFTD
ncbi:MAG: beta-ketoacyl-ACP synthase II [Xanthomonadales bacterium]|nr:beta-ketoacyl-ACP synthase II [Gammaproteobacteria bacterium]MBT8075674.1 beta-ketoacyl-ACP synthase II [Gammaproteobacteria bacterium]NNK05250.1 beta-ketoacyl-ACP synthase II [Xanthomonadales bacterium]